MAVTDNPTALQVLEEEGIERAAIEKQSHEPSVQEFQYHVRTYRDFVRGVILFVAHVAVILIALAYFFG